MQKIIQGDALDVLKKLESESVDCVMTSPPYYGLRDYGVEGQLGNEVNQWLYLEHLLAIFREIKRVLKNTGTCWVNIGDSYGTGSGSTLIAYKILKRDYIGCDISAEYCEVAESRILSISNTLF